jgi:hypothetical protein
MTVRLRVAQHGYVTLYSVVLIGVVALTLTLSLLLLGIGSSRTGFTAGQSRQAATLATACAEEALEQIRSNSSFTGSNNFNLGSGSCTYVVTSQGGQNRTVDASGSAGTAVRKVKVILNAVTPVIGVVSWQDVADF